MVVFSNLPYRDDGYIYRAGNGSAAVEYRDLWCRPASGTFVVTMGGDPWGGGDMSPNIIFEGDGYGTVPQYFAMGN